MKNQIHILNGDALKHQFPKEILGEIIVARECLVEGSVRGENLDEFFNSRAQFMHQSYGISPKEYQDLTVSEFQKMEHIPSESDINLWFEDDLFCQTNFWFVSHLLHARTKTNSVFLVRPEVHTRYGFGGLNETELTSIYNNRTPLKEIGKIASLWKLYQYENITGLLEVAKQLKPSYPFILEAVEAHIERIPTQDSPGRPTESLINIMRELDTKNFGPVFREFNNRESIYGFGDLQVKRLFDQIIRESKL